MLINAWTKHQVVPLRLQKVQYPKCRNHVTKQSSHHCEMCDISLCPECVSSKVHQGHIIIHIIDYVEKMKHLIQRDIQE